ncbi:primosomal replication protein [Photobacterium japonica]|uniref:primosomal replication protein n=1 Tax=Photobacterium japonica TaxID=2910235 RepID=UPI003D15309A
MPDLSRLEQIVSQLAQQATQVDKQRGVGRRPLFDEQLFHCRSKQLMPCIHEIRHEIEALRSEQDAGRLLPARTRHVCERIVAQIQAVQRELATLDIRKNEPKPQRSWRKPLHELYQELAQHQEWERRLEDMVRDKHQLLPRCTTQQEQLHTQREIVALEARLTRCTAARVKIEVSIGQRERKG